MSIKKLLLILVFVTILSSFSVSAWQFVRVDWNATFDTGNPDTTQAVATDTQDSVIVTGVANWDFVTVKYNSAGVQQWNDTYNVGGIDIPRDVAVDSSDNIYITGRGDATTNIITVKYNSSGSRKWTQVYDAGINDAGRGVAVDSSDNIIVAAYGGAAPDFVTIKYNSAGAQQWLRTLDFGSHDYARGVAVDSSDNIIVAGYSNVSGANDFIILKYNSAGTQLWNTSFDTGFPDAATRVAVDSNDNIFVSGYQTTAAQREDYVTTKFDSSGNYIWNRTINRNLRDIENGIAVDNNDNIVVTGQSGASSGAFDYYTIFFNQSGSQIFNLVFTAGDDLAVDVAIDSDNSIIVAGFSDSVSPSGNDDYFTLKYLINPSCGDVIIGDTKLHHNMSCAGSALIINNSDLVLDCDGYNITGAGAGIGIKIIDSDNVTIKNCGVNNFAIGIDVDPSWNVTIANSSFANMTTCVYINQSNWTLVKNNTFYNCSYAVRVLTGHYNNITNNTINLTGKGILLELNSRFNTIHDNDIFNMSLFANNRGIHVQRSHNNTVSNNFIQDGKPGFVAAIDIDRQNVLQAANNTVRNNTVINAGPITMDGTVYNLAEFNNVTQSTGMGIWVSGRYHEVRNNNVWNCSGDGIELGHGYNNASGNILWGNGGDGIELNFGVNNSVINNRIYNNSDNGVFIDNGWDDHDIINNTIYNNGRNGVLVQAAGGPGTNNKVIGNNIYNNTISGVHFWQEGFNFIINNNITSNGPAGIILEAGSNSNNVTGNTVLNHTLSINLTNSDNNIIYNNYFDDPPFADAASTGNSWNITKTAGTNIILGPFLGGNYWGNYNGVDTTGDGLGDTLLPWKGITNGIVNGGDLHPLVTVASVAVQQVILNSTFGTNFTIENLTCYANATQINGSNITYHGYWFKDGVPQFDILNRSFYNGSSSSNDVASDVAVDSQDNMIIVGTLEGHWETVKYSSNGTFLWNVSEPFSLFSTGASAVTVDSADNIIVTGTNFVNIPLFGNIQRVMIIKYNVNGTKLWSQNLSYISAFASTSIIKSAGIAIDNNDDIFITGERNEPLVVNGYDFYIAKFNSAGVYQWIRVLDSGSSADGGGSIVIDSSDNAVAGGKFNNKGAIFTYNNTGTQLWNVTNVWSPASAFSFVGIDVDSQSNIAAGGTVWFGGARNFSVFKYNSSGGALWNNSVGGSLSSMGDLVVDYEDNILTTGITQAFGVQGSNIYTVKFYSNSTFAWQHLGDFGINEVGAGIETNSWGEPVIGGRQSPNSGGRRMLLAVYRGFFDYNETAGILKNVSQVNYTLTSVGDLWRCDVNAYDNIILSRTVKSNNLLITSPRPASIECSRNIPNNFTNCSNLIFFDNITMVRANCTGALSATFILTNVYDGTVFFTNSTTTSVGDWMILNNSDVQILDSGQWSLFASCNFGALSGNATENFTIPFGTLFNPQILTASQTVSNGNAFNVMTNIQCIGGECVNNTAALDPFNPLVNLTQPNGYIQDIYADSEFIYGAADDWGPANDQFLYVWNKTDLSLFATLPPVAAIGGGLQSVYADNDYIYTGGRGRVIYIFNRTDYATPFFNIQNLSQLPGGHQILSLISDSNYLYAGLSGGASHINVYSKPGFVNVINLTQMSRAVQTLSKDSTYLYAGSMDGYVYLYNLSDLTQVPLNLSGPGSPNCSIKSIDVDDTYIYAHGQLDDSNWEAFTRVWNKTNYAIVADWNDTTMLDAGIALDGGGVDFMYQGGIDTWWTIDGWLEQINKSAWTVSDRINYTNIGIKSIFCDEDYLLVGTQINSWGWPNQNGSVMVFNNPCIGPVPPVPITINSVSLNPSDYPVTTTSVQCQANVTTPGVVDTVLFNITYPDGSSALLSASSAGDIYTSTAFTVSSTSDHNCTVLANNTNGTSTSRTKSFFGGHKGIIPMNAGSPFYTPNQNPRNGSHQPCLDSLIPGQTCNSTWSVVPNGNGGDTWAFFTIYGGGSINTSRINITILGGPAPTPSGGGGGGSATRQYPPTVCVEVWSCGNWGACIAGIKRRICTDANNCGTTEKKPVESASCVVPFADMLEKELTTELPSFEEIEKEEHIVEGSAVVVEEPAANPWKELINSRNFVRAALLALIVSVLVYLFFLAGHLKTSAKPGKKSERLTDESFAAKIAVKKASKPKPRPKPISKESTEELLNELKKL